MAEKRGGELWCRGSDARRTVAVDARSEEKLSFIRMEGRKKVWRRGVALQSETRLPQRVKENTKNAPRHHVDAVEHAEAR